MARLNKERLLKLADVLKRGVLPTRKDVGFNMASDEPDTDGVGLPDRTGRGCGTACCVAGWASLLFDPEYEYCGVGHAAELLGTDDLSSDLFYPEGYAENNARYTNKRAAAVVRHLAETGAVDWERFKRDGSARKSATPTPNNPRG